LATVLDTHYKTRFFCEDASATVVGILEAKVITDSSTTASSVSSDGSDMEFVCKKPRLAESSKITLFDCVDVLLADTSSTNTVTDNSQTIDSEPTRYSSNVQPGHVQLNNNN